MSDYPFFIRNSIENNTIENPIYIVDDLSDSNMWHRFKIEYKLSNDITPANTLIIIMMNPSKASEDHSDQTVNRVLNYGYERYYSKVIILNSLSICLTDSKKLQNYMIEENMYARNLSEIQDALKLENKTIVLATGDPVIKKGAESIFQIYTMLEEYEVNVFDTELTKMGYTKHLRKVSKNEMEKKLKKIVT